jgi:deoxyribose-phosphate aldolase
MTDVPICRTIDSAVLKPELTPAEAAAAIRAGLALRVRCVCVRPMDLAQAVALCRGTDTAAGVVLGFPHGVLLPASKADEARRYVALGAEEIDMVANVALIRSGDWSGVAADVGAAAAVTRPAGVVLKVILETTALQPDRIARATRAVADAGADFAKTSTGYGPGGATEAAVAAMVAAAGGRIGVKASGGIRTPAHGRRFLEMGCTRLGVGWAAVAGVCGPDEPTAP